MFQNITNVKRIIIFLFLAAMNIFILISCGSSSMMITVKRPAEVNLKGYSRIAIGDIADPNGRVSQHSRDMADMLTSVLFDTKKFEVLDRQNLKSLMQEQKLSLSGLVDESSAVELGKIIGSAALVFGRIQKDSYKEITSQKKWTEKKRKGKKGHKHTVKINHTDYYRNGNYKLGLNVKLVDIQTAKILAVKNLFAKASQSVSKTDAAAPSIDRDVLYLRCVKDIKKQFRKMVAPYKTKVSVNFQNDDALPEVKAALVQFKIKEWDAGVALLKKATEKSGLKPKVEAKAFYNYGLAKMYGGDPEGAVELFKKAMNLRPDSSRYQKAVLQAKEEVKKNEKLKEQG